MADTSFYHNCTVGGVRVAFRSRTTPEQMEQARQLVEEQYESLKKLGGQFGREQLLTLLVLGAVSESLHYKQELAEVESRLGSLVKRIEKAKTPDEACSLERA